MNLQEIEIALRSEEEEIRRSALNFLKGISLQDSLGIIITAMSDESWRVRKEAVDAFLGYEPDEKSIAKLLELLRNEDNAGLRNSAAEAIIRLGTSAAEPLVRMVRDTDSDVRKFIIDVMGAIGDSAFAQSLLDALNDPDVNVASAAAEHLGTLGNSSVAPYLINAIAANEAVLFRFSALEALGKLSPTGDVPAEILALANQDILRKSVYDYLGNASDAASLSFLIDGLSCLQKSARSSSLKALFKIYDRSNNEDRQKISDQLRGLKGSETVSGLLELFDSRDAVLVDALIWCSRVVGDISFVPLLIESFVVARFAESSLMSLKCFGEDGIAEVVARYSEADENARSALCILVGECGFAAYADMVKDALRDNSPYVRKAAAVAVGKLGLVSALPDLVTMIDDPSHDVCSAAVAALQIFASLEREAVLNISRRLSDSEISNHRRYAALLLASLGESDRLLLLANDENPQVRMAAVSSVGSLQSKAASGIIVMALSDEDPDVRIAAADALGMMKETSAVGHLEKALEDGDIWVQCAAMKALNLIAPDVAMTVIKRIHTHSEGLLMITCLQILESIHTSESRTLIQKTLESKDPDVVRQASKSLEICLAINK